jgi:hypothetical protein
MRSVVKLCDNNFTELRELQPRDTSIVGDRPPLARVLIKTRLPKRVAHLPRIGQIAKSACAIIVGTSFAFLDVNQHSFGR